MSSKFGSGSNRNRDSTTPGDSAKKFGVDRPAKPQKPYVPKVINEKRYLDPERNKLNKQKEKGKHPTKDKKTLNTKIRDLKKLIAHSEKKGVTAIAESKKLELKELTKSKRDKRKFTFIDQQYKHIKMYESKRLRKQLKKLEADQEDPDRQAKIDEVRRKIIYVKFYPRGEKYISILKDDTLTDTAKRLREEFWARATRYFEAYKQRVLKTDTEVDYHKDLVETDKFFMDDDEQHQHEGMQDDEDDNTRGHKPQNKPVARLEVDKRGNVIKRAN